MTATEIEVEQGTPEWFEARLPDVTASELNSVFAKGKDGESNSSAMYNNYKTQIAVQRVTGKATQTYKSASMQQGNDTEALAALAYSLKTGILLRKCGYYRHNDMSFGCSPDRVAVGKKITVQIKSPEPTEHAHTMRTKKIPTKYIRQCISEGGLTDSDEVHFVSYNDDMPENAKLVIIVMKREEFIDEYLKIEAKVQEFIKSVDEEELFIKNYGG